MLRGLTNLHPSTNPLSPLLPLLAVLAAGGATVSCAVSFTVSVAWPRSLAAGFAAAARACLVMSRGKSACGYEAGAMKLWSMGSIYKVNFADSNVSNAECVSQGCVLADA
jgi:hypothetical protein